jgi:hypothetical protein
LYYAGATGTDYSQKYSSQCQGGAGVACDYNVGFAYVSYKSDTCDPQYAKGVSDSMGYMNTAFQSAQCVKIYGGSQSSYNSYGGGYGNNGYNSYNSYYTYSGTALSLLYKSNACFIQNYWAPNGGCPDPYGRLQYYQQNFNKGVRKSLKVDPYVTYRANMEKGKQMVKTGAILFMTAAILFLLEQMIAFRKRNRTQVKGKAPASDKHLNGSEIKKSRSVVGLVRSATGQMKKAVATAAASTVNTIRSKTQCAGDEADIYDESDGVMVSKEQLEEKGSFIAQALGSYEAPTVAAQESAGIEEASSDESAVKVDAFVEEDKPLARNK